MATAFTAKIVRNWVAGLVTRAHRPARAPQLDAAALRARAAALAASAAEEWHAGTDRRPRVRGFAPLVVVGGGGR